MSAEFADTYIVASATHFPSAFKSSDVVDCIYHGELAGAHVNRFAKKFASSAHIDQRCLVIDPHRFPEKAVDEENTPLSWLTALYDKVICDSQVPVDNISISYNMNSSPDFVPSLSSQLCQKRGITPVAPPSEFLYIGCASAIFSIDAAVGQCRAGKSDLAFVASFEQSSWLFDPEYDRKSPTFVPSLRGHAIFGDGAAGLLVAPADVAAQFDRKVRILDTQLHFEAGDAIGMSNGRFLVGDGVKGIMPRMAAEQIVLPLLERNRLHVSDIEQWSIHQGSHSILDEFKRPDILGLSNAQLERGHAMFSRYGNVSSPSCLVIFNDWFTDETAHSGQLGLIIGFGAGYYLGAILYECC